MRGSHGGGWRGRWQKVPDPIRKTLVFLVGSTLIVTGILLVVLPGPFTIPLLLAGLAVLATEFAWAASAADGAKHHGGKVWNYFRERLRWRRRED